MTTMTSQAAPRRRHDARLRGLLLAILAILVTGTVVSFVPGGESASTVANKAPGADERDGRDPFASLAADERHAAARRNSAEQEASAPAVDLAKLDAAGRALHDADRLIKLKQYEAAIAALDGARDRLTKEPRAFVLLGRALEGRGDATTARDFYAHAIGLDPYHADAYWGFATSSESLGDLESALGAMRSYLHTEKDLSPERLRIAQARSAIWEWESQIGRGPWGPTKGIPPGLQPEEVLRKDGQGVAILMPRPGTEKPDGSAKYEIKHQSKFELFRAD